MGLHIKPLMPLVGEGKADESSNNFMICYTTPHFFATEVLLFLVLFETQGWYAHMPIMLRFPCKPTHKPMHGFVILSYLVLSCTYQKGVCPDNVGARFRASYFVSDSSRFHVLLFLRSGIPLYLLWIHAAFHIVYTVLSGAFPAWCIQQNIERVQVINTSKFVECGTLRAANQPPFAFRYCNKIEDTVISSRCRSQTWHAMQVVFATSYAFDGPTGFGAKRPLESSVGLNVEHAKRW